MDRSTMEMKSLQKNGPFLAKIEFIRVKKWKILLSPISQPCEKGNFYKELVH